MFLQVDYIYITLKRSTKTYKNKTYRKIQIVSESVQVKSLRIANNTGQCEIKV